MSEGHILFLAKGGVSQVGHRLEVWERLSGETLQEVYEGRIEGLFHGHLIDDLFEAALCSPMKDAYVRVDGIVWVTIFEHVD